MSEGPDGVMLSDGRSRVILHPPRQRTDDPFDHLIGLVAGPFQGSIEAYAYANNYDHFCRQLLALYETLKGEARLNGYENFDMRLTGDGRGHIRVDVSAIADHYFGIELNFRMDMDQTQIPRIVDSIRQMFVPVT